MVGWRVDLRYVRPNAPTRWDRQRFDPVKACERHQTMAKVTIYHNPH